jgi:predicted metal-dependent enzyme (double-stranded beta helix superfamily)
MDALTSAELRELVNQITADEGWRHLVRHESGERFYEELEPHDTALRGRVGLWLICWMDGHDTGFHDHGVSSGVVEVVEGRLCDERPTTGGGIRARTYGGGATFDFGAGDIHRLSHAGSAPATSIHAYSPPLGEMGVYAVDLDGTLRRTQVPYTEELRPLERAA